MNNSLFSKVYIRFIIVSAIFLVTPYPIVSVVILLWGILYYLDKLYELKKEGK